jgi:hypothetical protein
VEHIYLNIREIKFIFVLKSKNRYDMFKANNQLQLFSFENELGKKQRKVLDRSKEKRVYREHFVVIDREVSSRSAEELNSSMLQSPDDIDATYRQKKGEHYKGFTINGTETANPDNPLQLITDISVNPNNVDDSQILNKRIDELKEKTPELNEIHTDGGYGSRDNDRKFEELEINQITTAVRGRESEIEKKN